MQIAIENYFNFIQKVMFNIATILGFWVGVATFVAKGVRKWYNNGGKESIALFTMSVLQYINSVTESLYYSVENTVEKPREV